MNHNPATVLSDVEPIANWLALALETEQSGSVHSLAFWANQNGARLIATARAYHRLRVLAEDVLSDRYGVMIVGDDRMNFVSEHLLDALMAALLPDEEARS